MLQLQRSTIFYARNGTALILLDTGRVIYRTERGDFETVVSNIAADYSFHLSVPQLTTSGVATIESRGFIWREWLYQDSEPFTGELNLANEEHVSC